ncbi:MAG: geranylgeranyl reductase family protein [Treponema sp.]|jgi:geranylgeranyl reductase family protein|nr:geranylgeranyl reductase family protein [Treponema sp.]
MNKRQVIVIGSGPGGSSAAFYLAQAGIDVLLTDKESWPRDKACGDAQIGTVFPIYKEMGIFEEAAAAAVNHMEGFSFSGVDEVITSFMAPYKFAFCTPRRIIDDIVRRGAVRGGADFLENFETVDLIIERGYVKGVRAVYEGRLTEVRADAVVIANGSHSMQARQVGIFNEDPDLAWYGARAYFDGVKGMDMRCIEEHLPHEMFYPAGYMWVFPEGGEVANIGVFITETALKKSGMRLEDFFGWWRDNTKIGKERLGQAKLLGEIKGWKLPSCRMIGNNCVNGAIAVGDAGNGIECFTGEGFNEAMQSGKIAAQVLAGALKNGDVSAGALSDYTKLAGEALNGYYGMMAAVRDKIASDPAVYSKFLAYSRALPDYPNLGVIDVWIKYMKEELQS